MAWGNSHNLRLLYFMRKMQNGVSFPLSLIYRVRYGLDISWKTKIGNRLYVGHAYNITVNPKAIIGNNVNLHKGVTIGQENRGKRTGTPCIGNNVWISVNSMEVGNFVIGDNVLIAPNAFVNVDVPSKSIVLGNPCFLIPSPNATEG